LKSALNVDNIKHAHVAKAATTCSGVLGSIHFVGMMGMTGGQFPSFFTG
jgi:hypothetical protein